MPRPAKKRIIMPKQHFDAKSGAAEFPPDNQPPERADQCGSLPERITDRRPDVHRGWSTRSREVTERSRHPNHPAEQSQKMLLFRSAEIFRRLDRGTIDRKVQEKRDIEQRGNKNARGEQNRNAIGGHAAIAFARHFHQWIEHAHQKAADHAEQDPASRADFRDSLLRLRIRMKSRRLQSSLSLRV